VNATSAEVSRSRAQQTMNRADSGYTIDQPLTQILDTETEQKGHPEEQIQAGPLQDRKFLLIASGIVVVALLLRLYRIGEQEFWFDEAYSFSMVAMPNWTARALVDSNPPLYYLLLRGWAAFAGQSEAGLRLLSAGFGTLFVVAVIWAGRVLFTPQVGLWSGGFTAVAPMHIYYSQEARTYTLFTLALLLTYTTLWRALQKNTRASWALVSASALLALYSHYFAILGLFPTAFLLLLWPKQEIATRHWLAYAGAALLSGLLFLPWLLWAFVLTPHSLVAVAWLQNFWERMSLLLVIPKSLEAIGLGGQAKPVSLLAMKQFARLEFPSSIRVLGLGLLLLLGTWVALPWGDSRLGVPWLEKRKAWLGMLLFLPLVALLLVSFYKPVYMIGRYDMVAFPAYALLIGLALAKVQQIKTAGPVLASIVALALLIPIGTKLVLYYQAPSDGSAQATAGILHASVDNGDVVVLTGAGGLTPLYYLYRLGYRWEEKQCRNELADRNFSCRFFPRDYELPYFTVGADPSRGLKPIGAIQEDVQDYLRPLRSRTGGIWVVLGSYIYVEGQLIGSKNDLYLLKELSRSGLRFVPKEIVPTIFQFVRS